MSAGAKLPNLMTVDEFLVWEPDDPFRYELVDGVPVAMAPTSNAHGLLQSELAAIIRNHLRANRPDCDVLSNPGVIPKLRPKINFRIPDLGVTCAPVAPTEKSLPEPVLLVEILSPSNQSDTMVNVWTYTTIPSVREVLVLHSDRVAADMLRRAEDGTWPDRTTPVTGGTLELTSIGFRVALSELYARTGLTG
jgi:Uma2 family endonuclease